MGVVDVEDNAGIVDVVGIEVVEVVAINVVVVVSSGLSGGPILGNTTSSPPGSIVIETTRPASSVSKPTSKRVVGSGPLNPT